MHFGIWNIRGLMDPTRQAEVMKFVISNNICCVSILETKLPTAHFETISCSMIFGWEWLSNFDYSVRGRIWVGWNPSLVEFVAELINAQIIHGAVKCLHLRTSLNLSVVYGEHTFVSRRPLWNDIIQLSSSLMDHSWMVAGDFNAIRDLSDRLGSPNT
ncbi:hypothetical protein BT93_L3230 [Corymbia citriodora subsp. variegata]|uniref:Endonuclease/exonuclease/phosphatase domain-containing protein n=1 Tax=Corymbia citriodora subsp. variegata TaxID=360336 RepID=A0A8T0CJ00_CORYI|nr:hypothetical protein BT93_L3230 [Corymbia citriodora subsp. variegata]